MSSYQPADRASELFHSQRPPAVSVKGMRRGGDNEETRSHQSIMGARPDRTVARALKGMEFEDDQSMQYGAILLTATSKKEPAMLSKERREPLHSFGTTQSS